MVARMNTKEDLLNSSFSRADFEPVHNKALSQEAERHVRFALSCNEIFEIPHINDLSDEEVDDVWMSPDDFKDIRRECQAIILVIEHDPDLLEGAELRGLEHHMLSHTRQMEAIQTLLYDTVDRIMRFHYESSSDVSDLLASMCQQISSRPEHAARQTATQDAKDAKA